MRTAPALAAVPTGRELRTEVRRRRRARREVRSLRQRAGDIYEAVLTTAVVGGVAVQGVLHLLRAGLSVPVGPEPLLAGWLTAGALLVCVGSGLRVLLSLGPMVAGPATRHWLLATPVRRRSLLVARFIGAATAAAAAAALAGAVVGAFIPAGAGVDPGTVAWSALIGAALGAGLVGGAVALQPRMTRAGRLLGGVLAGAGIALAATALAVAEVRSLPSPPVPALAVIAAGATVAAGVLLLLGLRALDDLERSALSAGEGLVVAVRVAGTWLDLSILAGVIEERRWRRIGRVRSRPLAGTGRAALLRADVRRTLRARGPLVTGLGLVVAPYAAAAVLPGPIVPAVTAALACLVAGRYAGGLRAVCRSAALRRSLGGTDLALAVVHLVVPLVTVTVWTAAVLPAMLPVHPVSAVLIPLGAVLVVYRLANRPPLTYSGALFDSPFGAFPVDLIRQLLRGPALLTVLAAVHVLLAA